MDKRAIVSLIYPEKIIFNGSYFQTTKINPFVHAILLIRGELSQQKKREFKFKKSKSPSCDLDRIQTCNLLSRNQMRYSVAPRGRRFLDVLRFANIALFSFL